ncbi:MAG: sulfotransferase domain-containing protein [Nannocystaceae bacterium]
MEHDNATPEPGIPWIRPEIQQRIAWRDGDVVVSVPGKSGTTWMMNIVHQLRAGGDADFADIYVEIPWIEFLDHPQTTVADVVARIDAMPTDRPRAFKSHAAPPQLPCFAPGEGPDVKYVVVARSPEEALVSFRPFIANHRQAWFDLWGLPREAMVRDDFASFYSDVIVPTQMFAMFFGFVAAWWPLRHRANVLFLHFADMKRDHAGSIRAVADFLGVRPTAAQWPTILENTSFAWMKAHQEKFEMAECAAVQPLGPGSMVRKGQAGAAAEDGMTPAIAADLRARGRRILSDEAALAWLYGGGPLDGAGAS